jgi:hypothetical protein
MAKSSWLASEVTREHLQNLVSKGHMTAVEFATCLVPVEPISPAPLKGYVMVCAVFHVWGFGVPSHRFLCSLLRSYGL